jgi:hypothetical protein
MPLNFPNNPSVGQTYQSGSSATYQFNNSGYWNVVTPSPQTFVIAPTASYLDGELPTVIFARNNSGQSIGNNVIPTTIMTGWTNTIAQNASEWNRTTGVFTATKFGTYSVSAAATYGPTIGAIGNQYNIAIVKNGLDQSIVLRFVEEATNISRATGVVSAIVSLSPGETMSVNLYHVMGSSRPLVASLSQNFLNIEEIPRIIQR